MKLDIGFRELVAEAEAKIKTVAVADLLEEQQRKGLLLVDLRDVRELWREGTIPGSAHVPRGLLEFWIDSESPYFNKIFFEPRPTIFFCNKGWRSALATEVCQRMGMRDVAHLAGGFEAWVEAGGAVEKKEKR